jgi:hypothetical protein
MSTFLDRNRATSFVRETGVPVGNTALANLASDGKGPRYSIINGRALYRPDDLLAWVNEQASAAPRRKRQDSNRGPWIKTDLGQ